MDLLNTRVVLVSCIKKKKTIYKKNNLFSPMNSIIYLLREIFLYL